MVHGARKQPLVVVYTYKLVRTVKPVLEELGSGAEARAGASSVNPDVAILTQASLFVPWHL